MLAESRIFTLETVVNDKEDTSLFIRMFKHTPLNEYFSYYYRAHYSRNSFIFLRNKDKSSVSGRLCASVANNGANLFFFLIMPQKEQVM